MSENLKRMGTFLLAVVMVFSMVPMGVFAETPETDHVHQETVSTEEVETVTLETTEEPDGSYLELVLDEPQDAVITSENQDGVIFQFVPEASGIYDFMSLSEADTYGVLYDDQMVELEYDDDAGEGYNFRITYYLEAGKTYYLQARYLSRGEGTFQVRLSKSALSDLESIAFTPVSVIENTAGYETQGYDEQTESNQPYWYYSEEDLLNKSSYTITCADGAEITGNGNSFEYGGEWYEFEYRSNQSYENRWLAGGNYEMAVSIAGLTANLQVQIVENPLQSLTFTSVSVIESTCGNWDEYYDEETGGYIEYWHYNCWDLLSRSTYTATFADGTVLTGNNSGFYYDDVWYGFSCREDQRDGNSWKVGNTYYLTISVLGVQTEVPVTIAENPLQSLTFAPIAVGEQTCGGWQYSYDEDLGEHVKTYWHYSPEYLLDRATFTAAFTDGTVITDTGRGFEYDGQWYEFDYNTEQSEKAPWLAENTYTMTVSVLGQTVEASVTINPLPQLTLGEETDVEIEKSGDTVTFIFVPEEDGFYEFTSISDLDTYGKLDDDNGEYLTDDDDGAGNRNFLLSYPLVAGKTYRLTVGIYSADVGAFQVLVRKSPLSDLESISFTPVSIIENSNGYMDEDYDEETDAYVPYWRYHTGDALRKSTYTLTFSDGTVITGSETEFEYKDQWFNIEYSSPYQSYENRWTVGNTYPITVTIGSKTAEVPVTIVPSPLQSITFTPIAVAEKTYGDWQYRYDEDLGEQVKTYWYYYIGDLLGKSNYTLSFADGTVITGTGMDFEYEGQWYTFDCNAEQNEENPWLVGNTYTITVSAMGQTAEVPVTINPLPKLTLDQESNIVIENPGEQVSIVFMPEKDGIYDFVSISNMDPYANLYDDNGEYLTDNDDGGENNNFLLTYPLEAGKTYRLAVGLCGSGTGTFQVLVRKSPLSALESISFTPVSVMENSNGYTERYYDEETDTYIPYWYYYTGDLLRKSTYTLTFSDGTVVTGKGTEFVYNGQQYRFNYTSRYQSYENRWTVGNTYPITVTVGGKTATVPVTIVPTPLESIVFTPVAVKEEAYGYWDNEYVDEVDDWVEYWRYDIGSLLRQSTFTATFSDGTVITDSETGFWYDDEWYQFSWNANQSVENPWLPGNTYPINVSVMGQTAQIPVTICAVTVSDGYEYMVQGDQAIIYSCSREDDVLQIPEELDGYPVTGILSLGEALCWAQKIIIPDSVTMLSRNAFYSDDYWWYDSFPLTELVIGSGVSGLDIEMFGQAMNLKKFVVSEENPNYCSVDGVLYNADCTAMVIYPFAKKETHVIPDSVKDVDVIFDHIGAYGGISFQLGAGVEGYVDVDGVIYNEEMTKVFFCTGSVTGSYVMPDTVEEISQGAFLGSNITELTISSNVTEIVYGAFMGSAALEKVNMPNSVAYIGEYAFYGCNSLKSVEMPGSVRWVGACAYEECTDLEGVYITDLTAWCGICFEGENANPLKYAKDLYLNGKLIKDLVIPATVTETVYSYGINYYTFVNGSMTSVTIPASVQFVGDGAFVGSDIEKATIAEGIYYMGSQVFAESALKSVVLPNSLQYLGEAAFAGCANLKSATIGTGMTIIPAGAFYNTKLTKIVIPKQVEYIGESAFERTNISDLVLNCENVYIGDYAFQGCPVKDLDFGSNVQGFGRQTFEGAKGYKLTIPEGVTELTYRTFGYNDNLACVTIPESMEYMYWNAFEGDDNLSHVLYAGTQQQWQDMEVDCYELNNATIHYNATGNEVTIKETCSAVKLYCSVCKKWETIKELDGKCNFASATCTKAKTCKVCGETEGSALGHSYKSATCTKAKTCSRCSATSGKALGHSYKSATCTKAKTCSRCSATSGKKLGHTYTNSCDTKCNRCDAKRSITHKYTAKTCGKTTTCSVCGKKGGKLAHSYSNACDTKCNRCGNKRTIKHDYENKTTKATMKKNGKVVKACSVCGKVSSTTTVYKIKSVKLSTTKYTYNGKKKTPTVTVKDSKGKKLKKDTDYTVSYDSGRKKVGEYEVTVKFKGKYSGTEDLEFKIVPKESSIKKLTAKSKALEVKINRQTTQATGYQIEYSTSKSFKSSTKVTISDENTSKTTIKGLKKKKTYYVRIRTYKTVDGKKFYSAWSSYKSMKTK